MDDQFPCARPRQDGGAIASQRQYGRGRSRTLSKWPVRQSARSGGQPDPTVAAGRQGPWIGGPSAIGAFDKPVVGSQFQPVRCAVGAADENGGTTTAVFVSQNKIVRLASSFGDA